METEKFLRTMSKSFCEMRAATELVDVILVFGDAKIPCHKVVLAGTCDYFRTMFVTELKESRSDEVQISEISADIGLTLVNYLYSGTIEITEQNAQALLAACNMLLLVDVKKDIVKFLIRQICNSNCVSLMNLARFYELDSLRKAAHKFLTKHWTELIDTKEMGELQEDDFVELLKSLGSQEDRFRFLQNWIRLGGSDKDDRFIDLIEHVTLTKCSKEFICNVVMSEERMNHPKGMKLIQKTLKTLMLADQPKTPSQPSSHMSLVVADNNSNAWICSDNKTWNPIQWHAHKYASYSGCSSPEGFIISGGNIGSRAKSQCFSYVAQVKQWRTLPNMRLPRYAHSSIYHKDMLYLVGGMVSQNEYVNSVERLDTKLLNWVDLRDLPGVQGLSNALLVIVNDKLFVLGGLTRSCHNKMVMEYHFENDAWEERNSMPEECRRGAAVEFDGFIFVVGGQEKSCMRYCPRRDNWDLLQRTTFSHMFGPAMVWNDAIIVGGGFGTDAIEEYCPHTDTWSTLQLKMPKSGQMQSILKIRI